MADPLATVESVAPSVGSAAGVATQIAQLIAKRPTYIAQLAAHELAAGSASTAPFWRWVRIAGPISNVAVRGTSVAVTVTGAAGLALTLGIPLVVAVGGWVMLGAGYYQARIEVRQKGFMSGFSQGFTMGVLKWTWEQAVYRFGKRYVIHTNAWDGVMDQKEAEGYNEGLVKGFGLGSGAERTFYYGSVANQYPLVERVGVPKNSQQGSTVPIQVEVGKNYRIALRKLANIQAAGEWSRNFDEARLQQRNYVIELAAAGLRHGLIVAE